MRCIPVLVFIFFLIWLHHPVTGQVEHNYPVGPQNTTCDSLDVREMDPAEAIKRVENTVFRFDQQFRLSRTGGVRAAHYYSCDGRSGYLVVMVDHDRYLYLEVPKKVWNELITSSDIDGFYEERIRDKFRQPGD